VNLGVYGILLRDARSTATVSGWRLDFAAAIPGGFVYATITEVPGEHVTLGVIDNPNIHRYDAIEGFQPDTPERGFYRRVAVTTDLGEDIWAYSMNRAQLAPPEWSLVTRMRDEYERLGIDMRQLFDAYYRSAQREARRAMTR